MIEIKKNKHPEMFNGFLPEISFDNVLPAFKVFNALNAFDFALDELAIVSVASEESGLILIDGTVKPVKLL